ncbi:uncharacterized protein LOC134197618 [Corticium candelabrum]|uniref:uncharacterized protein LOC134197618 n=1 Tax=Corticium candelabrum TaxID=121492 RepID=UPI002E268F9B|nr:uncharacterized protein LOC134197618 [Corticium candelabrum]
MDEVDEDFVRKRVEEGNSHAVISEELQTMFPGLRGLSERSVRRFCTDRGLGRRCSLTKEELERRVSDAVSEKLQRRSSVLEMSTTLNDEQKKTYASATKLELMSSEVSEIAVITSHPLREPPLLDVHNSWSDLFHGEPLEQQRSLSFSTESTPEGRLREERGTKSKRSSIYQNTSENDIVPESALEDFC